MVSKPETMTRIVFIEIDDPIHGLVRITRFDPMFIFLKHNLDNPDTAARAYTHNILGHVYYSGLLGQFVDHKKSLEHFYASFALAKEIKNTNLIKSNGMILTVMYASGSGMTDSDNQKARQFLEEARLRYSP